LSEARLRLDAASQRITSETPQEDVVRIWEGLGRVWGFSDPARAFEAYSRALPIRRAQGDETLLALLLVMMGRIAQVIAGRADESNALIDEAEPLIMRSDLARLKGQLFRGKANAAANVGDFSRSIASMCRACDAFRDAGADAADTAETSLAYMMWASGDIEGAIALCHRVIERIRREQFPNGPNLGFALGNLAGLLTERGDVEAAQVIFSQAVPLLCDPWQLWVIFDHVALCRAKAARYEDAALSMGFAEAAYISHRASRQINESRAHEATRTILRARLDPREMELLMSAGARLDERAAAQLAASF
jgi:tetratricopeptide (TPR) repeat protein